MRRSLSDGIQKGQVDARKHQCVPRHCKVNMALYHHHTSPQHLHHRPPTASHQPPDVTVDFARQMSITSDAEIVAALEQQVHQPKQAARCRRLLDRRHSLAALAPQAVANRPGVAEERIARLNSHQRRPATANAKTPSAESRSAEQLLSPAAARSRSPATCNRTCQQAPQPVRDRLSVSNSSGLHHGRSQSVRTPKRPATAATSSASHHHSQQTSTLQSSGSSRPRGTSLPSHRFGNNKPEQEEEEADYYLLRHFIVQQGNRVVNRGDSLRRTGASKTSTSCWTSINPAGSQHSSASSISTENVAGSPPASQHHPSPYSDGNSHPSSSSSRRASLLNNPAANDPSLMASVSQQPEPLRVLMLGASGVGKSALTAQFMTSEYLNTYEASLDDDTCDRSVSVLLDGEESQLVFIDHPHGEISVENCMSTYNPHAYVIVYSVVDGESLNRAEEILHFLWRHSAGFQQASTSPTPYASSSNSTPPIILVANKIDLARSRVISSQAGKSLAVSFDCKYIETSSGMQHNVDELLVGILKQIRLKMMAVSTEAEGCTSSVRSLFRKRSAGRHHQQRYNNSLNPNNVSDDVTCNNNSRRSTSLRVRRMLCKVWPNCTDFYQNKSRSCEDLHVL